MKRYLFLVLAACALQFAAFAQTPNVNPNLFLEDGTNVIISTVSCTLSDGSTTTCYEITTTGTPADHNMGPWCPDNIADGAEKGGIWLEGGQVYDVDGTFIQNMATFYNDSKWLMYDGNTKKEIFDLFLEFHVAIQRDMRTRNLVSIYDKLSDFMDGFTAWGKTFRILPNEPDLS